MVFLHRHRKVCNTEVGVGPWLIVLTDLKGLSWEECGRLWDFGLGKLLNALSRVRATAVRSWMVVVLRAMRTMETQLKRFQRGMKLGAGLETILVMLWCCGFKTFFSLVLRISLRPNLESFQLISLAEGISRQPNIDPLTWLPVLILLWVYRERASQ